MKRQGKIGGTLLIVIALVAVIGGILVKNYNRLVTLEAEVDGKYAQVENVVKRRADLIPNLVNTVKGYAPHEEETLTKITEARSKFQNDTNPIPPLH